MSSRRLFRRRLLRRPSDTADARVFGFPHFGVGPRMFNHFPHHGGETAL